MAITDELRARALRSGLKQMEIAAGAGLSQSQVSRFMSGHTSAATIDKIADFFDRYEALAEKLKEGEQAEAELASLAPAVQKAEVLSQAAARGAEARAQLNALIHSRA